MYYNILLCQIQLPLPDQNSLKMRQLLPNIISYIDSVRDIKFYSGYSFYDCWPA